MKRKRGSSEWMRYLPINLLPWQFEGLQRLIDAQLYPNMAEAIRFAVSDMLKKELPLTKK